MTVEEVVTLYDYNYWANAKTLEAAARLEREQFLAAANQSEGSLRGTLVHILAVEWMWRMRCQTGASPPRYIPPERFLELESIRVAWREEEKAMRDLLHALTDDRLTHAVRYTSRRGMPHEHVLWHALLHAVNHGTQHRAEAGLRLAELGRGPGDLDLLTYLRGR